MGAEKHPVHVLRDLLEERGHEVDPERVREILNFLEKPVTVLDFISIGQLRMLRAAGFVVVHQVPSKSMKKAGVADKWPEDRGPEDMWHRMVAQSIREQNAAIEARGQNGTPVERDPASD